jgi:hypothetical protein
MKILIYTGNETKTSQATSIYTFVERQTFTLLSKDRHFRIGEKKKYLFTPLSKGKFESTR